MLIFIDESGDAGFKIDKGSSRFFVMALLIFDNELQAKQADKKIEKFKISLLKGVNFEFKFNKSSKELRRSFLYIIKDCKFRIRALILDKEKVRDINLQYSSPDFYKHFIKELLLRNKDILNYAKVRIDSYEDRPFKRSFTVYLRKNLKSYDFKIKDIKFLDSKKDNLIQMVDMIVGSIKRYYLKQKTDFNYYKPLIDSKIEKIFEL